ncbi:MAG: UDP-N-acetylmuramate dehydrogenase [Calditrichaeota bacterium]|nr:MAG: UDP-N-acetylmuramate dehydrogenase [Calditrichota bacterium]
MMKPDIELLANRLAEAFGRARVKRNEILAKHCNWRVGGPADLFFRANTAEELVLAARLAKEHGRPVTVLGFGANVLVSDKGIRGLVILNRAQRTAFGPDAVVQADSGTNLAVLAKQAAQEGVAGLEFLIGIPGTVGAAVAVNAGTRTEWISGIVRRARILTSEGAVRWLAPHELDFAYRNSRLKRTGEIVICAEFQGKPDSPERIEQRMAEHLRVRQNQPTGPSTGSVFKNPDGDFAGRLIEACGLKGLRIGGAQIAEMHANFILNTGGAQARDMKALIERAKTEVRRKFGVELEEEVRYLGEW